MPLVNGPGNGPSPGRPTPGVVKQDKSSGGSVDTTKTRWDPQTVRMSGGERPIGAAKGTQPNTEALCHPPPDPSDHSGKKRNVLLDKIWSGLFWYPNFWVPDPPPPSLTLPLLLWGGGSVGGEAVSPIR